METKYIFTSEQIRLAYFEKYTPESNVVIILIHGLAEHKGRYEYFLEKLWVNLDYLFRSSYMSV